MPGISFSISALTRALLPCLLASLLTLGANVSIADTPHLVLDINTQTTPVGSDPVWLGKMGNFIYFIARPVPSTTAGGAALFKTDGTTAGTTQVAAIDGVGVLPYDSGFTTPLDVLFLAAGTKAYFLANTTTAGQEVWVTDGTTAGTHLIEDIYPGPNGRSPRLLGLIGTDLIFAAAATDNTLQLYRTDGTAAGTHVLSSFAQSQYGLVTDHLALNGKVFVAMASGLSCCEPDLWVTDGTTAGTAQIDSNEGYPWHLQPSSLRAFGNSVAMLTDTENLGVEPSFVDTTTNALTILDTVPGPGGGAWYGSTIAAMDGFVLFVRGSPNDGAQLWRSDGTLAGTTEVMDLGPGVSSSMLGQDLPVTRVGNRAVFLSENAQNGAQLWGTDGTAQGTVPLISDVPPTGAAAQNGAVPSVLGVAGTHGYFALSTGSDYRIVVTDGTVAGTHLLGTAGPLATNPVTTTEVAGDDNLTFIYELAYDSIAGYTKHLFAYTPQTNVLTDLRDTIPIGEDDPPLADSGRLFFKSTDPLHADEPWISDGTSAGTHILANIAQEVRTNDSNPNFLTDVDGTLYFSADDGVHGVELWKSDGTAGGTSIAFDIAPGAASSNPSMLVAWNGSLYFFNSYDGTFMRTTGAVSAVSPLATLFPEPLPTVPSSPQTGCNFVRSVAFNGRLYFGASDQISGFELWSTDGTAAGTNEVADIGTGALSGMPCNLTVFNNRLYFRATPGLGASGFQLWSTDGTAAGTAAVQNMPAMQLVNVGDFVVLNSRLYFDASDGNGVTGVYSTDGTGAGTQLLKTATATDTVPLAPIGTSGGRLVLTDAITSGVTTYQEIWLSDGTAAGTAALPGVQSPYSAPILLTDQLIFFVNADATGQNPWVSDGTVAGTHMLAALGPGTTSQVLWFATMHGVVYFASNDAANGARIWRTDGTSAGTVVVGSSALPALLGPVQASGQNLFFAATDSSAGLELNVLRNDPPVAANDTANSSNGAPVTINVVANDTDDDGTINPGSVRLVSLPAHGTAVLTQSGSVTYTPNSGYEGSDTFTYTVADNQGATSNDATVTVTSSVTPTVTVTASRGGGGSFDLLFLLLLGSVALASGCIRTSAP